MKLSYKFSLLPTPVGPASVAPVVEDTSPVSLPPEIWSIPPFAMVALPGFECISTQSPITFRHPAGHVAIITVRRVDGNPSAELTALAAAAAVQEVEAIFEKVLAQYGGSATRERFNLPEGVQLLAARANPISFSGARYFMLYGAVAPKGHLALLTIEGPGESNHMALKYDSHLKAVRFAT